MTPGMEIHKQRIPRRLLFFDALGAVLVAIGVLDLIDAGPRLVPEALSSPTLGIGLIVIGVGLMLALPAWMIRRHRRARE